MECSVGLLTKETCHKETYGKVSKDLINFNELDGESQELLSLMLNSDNINTLCEYHKKSFCSNLTTFLEPPVVIHLIITKL